MSPPPFQSPSAATPFAGSPRPSIAALEDEWVRFGMLHDPLRAMQLNTLFRIRRELEYVEAAIVISAVVLIWLGFQILGRLPP